MIFFLAKFFSKREYAEEFTQGKMFVNRLSYFKGLEDLEGRGDELEGAIVAQMEGITITIRSANEDTGSFEEHTITAADLAAPPIISPEWFDNVNVYCMYACHNREFGDITMCNLEEFKEYMQVPEKNEQLGIHAVLVTNTQEFLARLRAAAEREGFKIRWGLVNYYDPEFGTPPITSEIETIFNKREDLDYQREFRIALDTGTQGECAIRFDIGDISDITSLMETNSLTSRIEIDFISRT